MIKIGYQGEVGSNNEVAAIQFAKDMGFESQNCEFIPLVEAKYVISSLKSGKIDYGVVATRNSIAGTVKETYEAIKDEYLEFMETVILPIHHCVFVKDGVSLENITTIVSHIQALDQTRETRAKEFPGWVEKESNDTASAARNLAQGALPDNCAVICRKDAGEKYGLKLVRENIEDIRNNKTEFRVFKKSEMDYSESNRPTISQWLGYQFTNENGLTTYAKIILLLILGIISAISYTNKISPLWPFVIYTAIVILFFTSNSLREKQRYKALEGYWKYYPVSVIDIEGNDQKFTTPRIVKIVEEDGELKLYGVICDKENVPMFESKPDGTFVSSMSKNRGGLVYVYESPATSQRTPINGIAYIKWHCAHIAAPINIMRGIYYGTLTEDQGTLTYLRITEEEYNRHCDSMFI